MTTSFAPMPTLPRVAPLDPLKHVNYVTGMVLGVQDFTQEYANLAGHDRRILRDVVGYGTLWGLKLAVEEGDAGPRVVVAPGVAVSPCGQLICVTPAQCADLDPWLDASRDEIDQLLTTVGSPLPVYVVLCYRECETDDVPIPGEPCRTDDQLTAPSRLKEDFRLELRLERPWQPDEEATRGVVRWLRAIPLVDGGGTALPDFLDAFRAAVSTVAASPPASPPIASPPCEEPELVFSSPPSTLAIPRDQMCDYLGGAFRIWSTEMRPLLRTSCGCECGCGGDCGCGAAAAGDACEDEVLLGALSLPLTRTPEGVIEVDTGADVDDADRPYLL